MVCLLGGDREVSAISSACCVPAGKWASDFVRRRRQLAQVSRDQVVVGARLHHADRNIITHGALGPKPAERKKIRPVCATC